jgi:hypothetical protein
MQRISMATPLGRTTATSTLLPSPGGERQATSAIARDLWRASDGALRRRGSC